MTRAKPRDKEQIVRILTEAFDNNKSVNYLIPQDNKREVRIRRLMEYAFDNCSMFGEEFITEDKNGCALLIYPDKKRITIKSLWLDVKFAVACLGLGNVRKAMQREAKINRVHPDALLCYLWFIGIEINHQNKGIGSNLMKEITLEANRQNRVICPETSTVKNIPWYQKFGFIIYKQFDFGYTLYCLKKAY